MANICIIKDKKFRERAKAFNISTDTLEHITYKYYEEKKSNDQNPSDTYIKAQLGEFSYVEENPKIAELAKSIWDSKYSKPLSFDSEEQREKAKNAAEAIFPPQVILLYTDSQDKKILTIRKPVTKLDIKYRKDFSDWHNYNDYLLAMGDAIPQKERQIEQKKTGPQPFTFNDGVTVTAPFKPNEQQVEALNAISDFINSDEVSMTLSGYAGTGKTSLMELIAAKMKKQHRKIVFTASTNKAAAVLKNRVKNAGFTAQTLNKVFGIQVEVDSSKPYDASNLVTLLKEADVSSGTVVVIDEASMINEENYSILNKIAKDNNLKIIYTGDKGQLAPVKEAKISKVFRDKNRKVVTLTKVERTDDNAILKEATALRNGQPLSGESSFNSEGKGVAYIKPANKEGKRAIVKAFAPMLRKNPDFFRILAFTNKAVADYNTAVRNALGYHNSTPRVGEPIVGYSNWGAEYDRRTKQTTYRFINSESYNIVGIKPAHKVSYTLENGTKVELMANTATIEDSEGKKQKVDIIDIKDNPQNLEAATILAKEKSRLFSKARTLPRKEQPAVYREINAIEEFLFVNDNIKEGNRTLQNKTFDFGYAMTVHKSQGSTFTHVLVDDTDIAKARSQSTQTTSPDYDAFSSMVDNSDTIIEGTQTADSGFDSASSDMQVTSQGNLFAQMQQSQGLNAQTINNQANETTNIRQQLEYVAVSRATDTVTIISNNVKTEDSPLNHIPKNSTQGNLDIITSNRKEMTPQLTQQLQALLAPLGNKVHGLADMRKYFQENPNAFDKMQQAIEEEEMAGIKAKAIANGTFMKAPNGNPTNLTERQWLQVRTKNFINWFGDWINDPANASKVVDENGEPLVVYHGTSKRLNNNSFKSGFIFASDNDIIGAGYGFQRKGFSIGIDYALSNFAGEDIESFGRHIDYLIKELENEIELGEDMPFYQEGDLDAKKNLVKELKKAKQEIKSRDIFKEFEFNVFNIFQNVKNPLIVDAKGKYWHSIEFEGTTKNTDEIAKIAKDRGYDGLIITNVIDKGAEVSKNGEYAEVANDYIAFESNQIKSATDNIGTFSTENNDTQMFIGKKKQSDAEWKKVQDIKKKIKNELDVLSDLPFFLTPEGEIYGFVAPNGDIYLDETKISPEHLIHEYTHLWDRIVAKKNPKLWKRGIQLMKQTSLWKQIENDSNYGKRWKEAGRNSKLIEQLIASEVHARFVGEGGQQLLDNLAKEKGAKGIIGKLKQWILDFWKDLKATFSDFSDDEIQKLTLKDFNHMTMRDFADAVNFAKAPLFSEFQGITPEQVKQAKDLQRNKIESIQGQIGWIEERRKWNKATGEQLKELTKLQQDLAIEQSLYDGLDTGVSTIIINEHGIPQVTTKDSLNRNSTITQQSAFDISKAEFYSGAADGADKAWGAEARELGIKVTDYTRDSWNSLSQEWKNKLSAEYEEVARALARPIIPLGNKGDIEVRRDMMQADKADAIFAIGSVIKPGHKGNRYVNKSSYDVVDGGTGYAVQRGIIRGIPVYVFDQSDNQWKVWDRNSNTFISTSEPTLTPHAATIGTRGINDAGRQAIRNVLAKIVSQQTTQQNIPASYEGLIKPDANTIFVFGSNPEGRHGAGAAKTAREKFGAVYGQGEGLQGNSYALPTKELRSKPLYSEDGGKTPVTMYRGYALTENREAYNIEETVGKTAVDYDESLKGALYFTSSKEEAQDYAKGRTDKSPEPPTQENPQGRPINRHYTGDYAKVSRYFIAPNAKVEHFKDIRDYIKNGRNSDADVIILDKGTAFSDNTEYIVKNPNIIVYDKMLRSISPAQITENIRKMYEVARKNPSKQFKVAYTNGLDQATFNGYTGAEMIKMFKDAGPIPSNVVFNKEWTDHWNEVQPIQQSTQQQVKEDNNSIQSPVSEVPSSEQTSQKVSLLGYEYFNDLNEDTEVDAAWKISVLQDLDSQLSTENTEDENLQILSQMDRVLQSPSQEEYEKAPTPQQEEINTQMKEYFKRNQQLNNLLDNNVGLSPSEIRSTAETIVNTLSDIITEIQQHPEKATEYWPTLKTDKDLSKLSRREIVEILSVNRVMELAKQRFENLKFSEDPVVYSLYDSRRLIEQHNLVMNNWEAVIRFAGDIFVANEGFGIKHNSKKGNYEVEEREYQGYDYDDYSSYQDPEATAEETDEQEHWQIEAKTISVINSMTEQIRMAIHNCYELDRNGNKILDKWGIPKRVNKINTVKKILYWTNGALNLKDMIARMEAQKDRNPWVTQLTQRLTDKSGKEADFQSQFYTTMHRHFQLYGIGQYEGGHYKHKILNRHKALSDTIKGISTLFQMHQHPLFNRNSTINLESLKALEGWYNELETIRKKYKLMMVFTSGEDARSEYVTSNDLELSDSDIETATKAIVATSKMLGYVTTEEEVLPIINKDSIFRMTKALDYMLNHEGLKAQAKNNTKEYKPFEFKKENNIRGALAKFLQPMMDSLEETALNTIFEDGKMYQSNVIPSFLSQLFDSFAQSDENFKPWAESFYGNSQWFKKDGRWRTPWLATMMENPEARKAFEHHVQLNFNKHNYMRNLSPEEYTISCITNYFFKTTNEKNPNHTEAWFRVPIQSNKPSSEFIKFFSYRGIDYKKQIVSAMQEFFLQELDRIDTVRKRNKQKEDSDYISSLDENGRHFMFLPFLNSYLIDNGKLVSEEGNDLFHNDDGTVNVQKNNELKSLLNEKLQAEQSMKPEKDMRLLKLVEEATSIYMQNRADQILAKYEKNGILKAAEKVENINDYGRSVRDNLENFLWNDFFAANNILQLTITDKAFYPTTAELQKRLAELHAPGVKANKYATDYGNPEKGIPAKRVSDGIYRTILISDYEGFTANIIDNLTEIFNRRIEQAPQDEKQAWVALKESLVGENGRYRNINVTDGQAYSSPASYRKKMLMFGKWSPEAEELYQKIRSGNYSLDDIRTVFQPLKPFVYGYLHKKTGVQNAPIQEMNVPFQAKNSEYLLLMADALIQGEKTGRPNILRAIYDVMEESEQIFPTKGIDTVQFKSAIKSGAQGIIHLSDFTENPAGEEMARTALREQIYIKDDSGKIVDYNYDTFVQSTDYDNYALQQEVPKHFQEHWQAEPSQKRANIMSDLDMWINPQGDKSDPANVNYYSWKDPDGTEHKLTAQEFRRKYEEVHAQNIEESFDELTKLFKFNSDSKLERNIALSELLQEEIESSPRYGIDLLQACQIGPKTGEFRIPKGDPIQSKRIEQLINSIIKNRVNKQKLAGGPIVQVTNWGTSRQLHIRFNDRNGNLLKTKEEYEQQSQQESYQDYIKKNQAGIAHFEIFAPASWKKHLEKFRNPDGSINFEAIEKCDPNLLKMITSRIPNEDKYSIAHGKIVGFMPEVAGEVIMFPYELTEIDDSDFDVDKRYCHVFEIEDIVEKDWNEISDSLLQKGQELYQQYFHTNIPERNLQGIIDAMVKNPQKFPTPNEFRKDLLTYYMSARYEVKYPKKGTRADRNNQILNMDWAVLSNEMTASKILNPGGFDIPKHDAYVIAVYKAKNGTVSWETLEGKTTKQLQKMMPADGDLAWFDTQVQFYKQNAAGSTLIGIFAVNKVAHAFLEADDILIDVDDVCGEGSSFNIADKEFTGRIKVDPAQDSNGAYVGKQLGSMVGASADTAKDPWLDLIGVNMTTVNVYNTLMRLGTPQENTTLFMGMPQKDAALFMSQDVLVTALEEYNRANMEEPVTFDSIISKKIMTIGGKYGYNQDSEINREPLTRGELKYGLLHDDKLSDNVRVFKDKVDYKVLLAFSKLQRLASAIRKPTFVTRLNSISSAVGPLIIDNIILEHKLREFLESENLEGTGFYSSDGTHLDMDDLLSNHPMLRAFSKAIDSREPDCLTKILFADMPAGSGKFKGLIEAFPDNIKDNIYKNRQLLSKLSDFYQSYMLVANGIINPAHLGDYIKKFPEYFVAKRIKEKYPDNAFIQAIQPFKKNGRGFLNTETTGMIEQEKERLRMAWTDLHKVNPTLSKQLLTYAFFRRGIGFSPETWTDLLSVYVKEHITSDNKNGSSVSYVDTYRHFPTDNMVESIIMEQFIRNNWNDSRIVPVKGGEGTYYDYSHLDKGILYVHSKKDKDNLQGIQFMRTTVDKKTYLWKRITPMEDTDSSIEFQRIMPLGNNGEYMEMSLDENMKALEEVDELKQNDKQPELPDNAPKDAAISDDSSAPAPIVSITEQAKSITDIVKYMITSRNLSEKVAVDYVATLHKKAQDSTISKFSKQDIQRIAKDNGLNLDVDAALEWFKSLC